MPNLIGSAANQVPVNGMLGTLAFQDGDFWLASPLKLLATVTPTAAAQIDFLNTFSSTYDNYLIVGNGINFAADDGLNIRLAVAGAVDTGTNYVDMVLSATGVSGGSTSIQLPGAATIRTARKGCNFTISIHNANATTLFKKVYSEIAWEDTATWSNTAKNGGYTAASVVTGFRLYSTVGSNFTAVGKIRVYGYV